jgi:ubiquitin carboxyl-terminal hydrolase 22/27/51
LKKPPINLIVVLKKYSRHSKSNANVFFPEIVDLKEFLENKNSKAVYYLYAMIEHVGFMNMGHYKCYCKNHMDKKWYCFNDRNIKEVTIAEVLKTQGYIGFYELEEVPQ